MATDAASSETTATVLRATAGQVRLQLEGGREVTKRVTVPISARETLVGTEVPVVVTGTGDKARVELADGWLDAAAPAKKPAAKRRARSGGDEPAADAAPAKKPAAKRRRSGGADAAATPAAEAAAKPARRPRAKKASPEEAPVADPTAEAEAVEAPKKRTRSRGKKATEAVAETPADETPAAPEAPVEEAPVEAATPGSSPSIAEEPKAKRSRSRSRGGRGKKSPDAAIAESPAKADTPVVETPAEAAPAAPEAVTPTAVAPLDPEVLRTRIAAAVDLVRAARAA